MPRIQPARVRPRKLNRLPRSLPARAVSETRLRFLGHRQGNTRLSPGKAGNASGCLSHAPRIQNSPAAQRPSLSGNLGRI
jgi:hypothetical protein